MAFKVSRLTLGWPLHLASVIGVLVLILAIWYTFPQSSSAVVLHYSVGVGVDFIGDSDQIRTLGIIGALFCVANIALGHGIYNSNRAAAWILWGINPFVQLFLVIAYLLLWQLNR